MKRLLVMVGFLGACAMAPKAPQGANPEAYWPLRAGQVMVFEAKTLGGKAQKKVRIKARKNGWFEAGRG